MIQDSYIVSFDLLLNLKNVNACRKLVNFTSADCVDQTGFTDTVAANQAILFATDKSQKCTIKQGLASNN